MGSQPETIDLLEQFMEIYGKPEKWITVEEIRNFFRMSRYSSPAIAGILRRLYKNPTFGCTYRVARIEVHKETGAPYRIFRRYLIQRK